MFSAREKKIADELMRKIEQSPLDPAEPNYAIGDYRDFLETVKLRNEIDRMTPGGTPWTYMNPLDNPFSLANPKPESGEASG